MCCEIPCGTETIDAFCQLLTCDSISFRFADMRNLAIFWRIRYLFIPLTVNLIAYVQPERIFIMILLSISNVIYMLERMSIEYLHFHLSGICYDIYDDRKDEFGLSVWLMAIFDSDKSESIRKGHPQVESISQPIASTNKPICGHGNKKLYFANFRARKTLTFHAIASHFKHNSLCCTFAVLAAPAPRRQ